MCNGLFMGVLWEVFGHCLGKWSGVRLVVSRLFCNRWLASYGFSCFCFFPFPSSLFQL